jgi:capsular polysaccharide biosynthesis protein
MTKTMLWKQAARTTLAALLAFFIVAGAAIGYEASRPVTYQARIVLVAVPDQSTNSSAANYPAAVSLTMAGVEDVARSRSVLTKAVSGVPNAPTLDVLAARISVDAVPGSGVVRISVSGDTAAQTVALTQAIGAGIVKADLLHPVGTFRLIDTRAPEALKIAPDLTLGLGFGLAAGLVAAVLAAAALSLLRPRLFTRRQILREVDNALVSVVELDSDAEIEDVAALLGGPSRPLLVPAGIAARPLATTLRGRLQPNEGIPAASDLVLVIVRRGVTTPAELRNAVSLVNTSGRQLHAIVLSSLPGTRSAAQSAKSAMASV